MTLAVSEREGGGGDNEIQKTSSIRPMQRVNPVIFLAVMSVIIHGLYYLLAPNYLLV